jgi:hypothetical protein
MDTSGLTPDILDADLGTGGEKTLRDAYHAMLDRLPVESREHAILSWIIGSQNQDRRGMLVDGEVMVAVSGFDALISMLDFMFIVGAATWPSDRHEFEGAFPPLGGPGLLKRAFKLIKDEI